jgi:curved DNA-binding protein CbpA
MTDSFALFGEPRRPWLDAEELKSKFLLLSSSLHPDRFHNAPADEKEKAGQSYSNLNTAYNTLREPKDRLLHLIELEQGKQPSDIQRIPPGTMDLFVEVGQVCRDADGFLKEKPVEVSPMLRLKVMQESMEWTEKLSDLQTKIHTLRKSLENELSQMNPKWEFAPPPGNPERLAQLPMERLEQIYRTFSYVSRWTEQIQERTVQLAF